MLSLAITSLIFLLVFLLCRYYWIWYRFCKQIGLVGPVPIPFLGQMAKQIISPGLLKADQDLFDRYGPVVPYN